MQIFQNKVVFITGGTSGIGKSIAKAFAAQGAKVIISARSESSDLANDINAHFVQMDISNEPSVEAGFASVTSEHGGIDVLVLNAGVALEDNVLCELSSDIAKQMIDINLFGTFLTLKHGANAMNDGGSIVTIGSAAGGGIAVGMQGIYAATKAGVHYLTRTAAIELAERSIRVNTIKPASIAGTNMMTEDDGGPEAKFFAGITALNKMGSVEDVASLTLYLASDQAKFITGAEIALDGGLIAGLSNTIVNNMFGE